MLVRRYRSSSSAASKLAPASRCLAKWARWACRPHRPQTKGKVERPFAYLETNLLNGRTFTSLEHLNETTALWLADIVDVHLHRETKRRARVKHFETPGMGIY